MHEKTDYSLIWVLTTLLFASFFIFYTYSYGSIVIASEALLVLLSISLKNNGKVRFRWTFIHSYLMLFAIFCIISSVWAIHKSNAITMGVTIVEIFICISILLLHYYWFDSIDALLKSILWGAIIVEIYTCYTFGFTTIIGYAISGVRLPSTFLNSNTIGMLAAISAVIIIYYLLNEGIRFWQLFIVLSIIIVAVSMSRKALVFLVAGIVMLLLLRNMDIAKKRSGVLRVVLSIVLLVSLFYYLSSLSIFNSIFLRMQGYLSFLSGGEGDNSTMVRTQLVRAGMEYFFHNPIFGIGLDNARYTNSANLYLHNNYAEMLVDGGLVGFCLYYSFFAYIGVNLFKYRKYRNKEYSIICTVFILTVLMDYGMVSYYSKETYFYYMLFYLYLLKLKTSAENIKKS